MHQKNFERVTLSLPLVSFTPEAAAKLDLYVEFCPTEISGLGEVEVVPGGFKVTDVFIVEQKSYYTYTELQPENLALFLAARLKEGKDPAKLKIWWHSHAELEVFWSPLDDYTAGSFQNEYMLSLVANKAGERLCRLDLWQPLRLTVDALPVNIPTKLTEHAQDLQEAIRKEIGRKVMFFASDEISRGD